MSKIWTLDIYEEPFKAIQDLGKEVEVRAGGADKIYTDIEEGDIIQFNLRKESVEELQDFGFNVTYNNHYSDAWEMIDGEGETEEEAVKRVFPPVDSVKEVVKACNDIPCYEERIEEYGIYAIGLGEKIGL